MIKRRLKISTRTYRAIQLVCTQFTLCAPLSSPLLIPREPAARRVNANLALALCSDLRLQKLLAYTTTV